jgi:hypothetical protein
MKSKSRTVTCTVMKLVIQCDTASCSGSESIEVRLTKEQEEKMSSFIREHGQLHTLIST